MEGKSIKSQNGVGAYVSGFTKSYMLAVVILLLGVVFSIASPYFLTVLNIRNILIQMAPLSVVAVGQALVLCSGAFDMSLGQNLCLTSCLCAYLMKTMEWNSAMAIITALLVGVIIGLVNGILVAYLGVAPFVATLGTQMICTGSVKILTNASPIPGMPDNIAWIGRGSIGGSSGLPICVLIMILLFCLMAFIMKRTKFGRNTYAVGGNREAAYFAGINVKRHLASVYVLAGFFAAFGGIILLSRLNTGAVTNGDGYEFDTMISCVIGGISMSGGKGKIWQAFLGAMFLTVFFNGMSMLNVNSFVQDVLKGIILVGAVLLDIFRNKKR